VTVHLLDGNVLVALADEAHVHHDAAVRWFAADTSPFATCPITQGTLLRMLLRHGAVASPALAGEVLTRLCAHPRHRFWADDLTYTELSWTGVLGQRQVTDAYLAALARARHGRLVTFDRGLAALHGDVAVLLPPAIAAD
jgi:toxin-antitoxin system PIN domain toxin